jgi:hypothetical protein
MPIVTANVASARCVGDCRTFISGCVTSWVHRIFSASPHLLRRRNFSALPYAFASVLSSGFASHFCLCRIFSALTHTHVSTAQSGDEKYSLCVTPCRLICMYQHFGMACCLCLKGSPGSLHCIRVQPAPTETGTST